MRRECMNEATGMLCIECAIDSYAQGFVESVRGEVIQMLKEENYLNCKNLKKEVKNVL